MADAVISFDAKDNASPKVKRIKGEVDGLRRSADDANRAMGKMGSVAGRMGGVGGSLGSRFLGGFAGGGMVGGISAAVAALGIGISAALAAAQRQVDESMARVRNASAWRKAQESDQDSSQRARDSMATSQIGNAGLAKRYLAAGGKIDDALGARARLSGASVRDRMEAELTAQTLGRGINRDGALRDAAVLLASGAKETLAESVLLAAKYQGRGNGLNTAYLEARGMRINEENKALAARAIAAGSSSLSLLNVRNQGLLNTVHAGRPQTYADLAGFKGLTSGATESATYRSAESAMSTDSSKAKNDYIKALEEQEEVLVAGVHAQRKLIAKMKDVGHFFGIGEGSMKHQLDTFRRNSAVGGE